MYVIALFSIVNQEFEVFSFWNNIEAQYAYRIVHDPVKYINLLEKFEKKKGYNIFINIVLMVNIPMSNR